MDTTCAGNTKENIQHSRWLIKCNCSTILQTGIKVYYLIKYRELLIEQRSVLSEIYLRNDMVSSECDRVINCAQNTNYLVKILRVVYLNVGCLLIIWPIVLYFLTGELHTIVVHTLMGVDHSTVVGYIITNIYQGSTGAYNTIMYIYLDGLCALYSLNVWLFSGLIDHQCKQLNKMLDDKDTANDTLRQRITFRNIIKMHVEMIE